ncbi:hypothetical protein J6590_078975 [Homalodisca vitripennis]|nr:hypothetical protein J6590_078975 [Homalodisca vitripennis]
MPQQELCVHCGNATTGAVCSLWQCHNMSCVFTVAMPQQELCVHCGNATTGAVCSLWQCHNRSCVFTVAMPQQELCVHCGNATKEANHFKATLLNRYLGKYIQDLDTENLNVGIFSGDVQLSELKLKPEALVNTLT